MGKFSLGAQLFYVSRSTDVHKSMRVIEVKHRASVKGNPSPSPQNMIKFDLKELFGGINVIYVSV